MGKIKCFSINGLEIIFHPDDHTPHHFHVIRRGEWEIRVFFMLTNAGELMYSVEWTKTKSAPASKILREIKEMVLKNQAEILKEWTLKVKENKNAYGK
jgi:hypothetical protein